MDKIIELIASWIQKNLKNPKLYATIIILIIAIVLVFPYIDANIFFYNRIEKRANILQSLSEIDIDRISQSPALQDEYNAILSEIEGQREWSISGAVSANRNSTIALFKFISGGALAWIVAVCVPFMNTFSDKKTKIVAIILVVLFGVFSGWIASIVPTVINPWINYVGFPILEVILLISLTMKTKDNE